MAVDKLRTGKEILRGQLEASHKAHEKALQVLNDEKEEEIQRARLQVECDIAVGVPVCGRRISGLTMKTSIISLNML